MSIQLTNRGNRVEVRATSIYGEARGEGEAPSPTIINRLSECDLADIPNSVLASVGHSLYQALMVGDVAKLGSAIFQDAMRRKECLQLELRFDPDQVSLAQYPWEMIADDLGRHLVRDGIVNLSRYISYPQPPPAFGAIQNIPFLQVVSQPNSLSQLNVISLPMPQVLTLPNATFDALSQKLLIERPPLWGLQFDGHGGMLLKCSQCDGFNSPTWTACSKCSHSLQDAKLVGVLAFEKKGDVDWITTEEFGAVLYNAHIRLAMLLACESGRVGSDRVFSGIAPGLILAGVPAVVGMQYPVLDDYANNFARTFYQRLLQTQDVLDAISTARQANARQAWYSPVLYLRQQKSLEDTDRKPTFQTREIDTATPAIVSGGLPFLVRLWIRRPTTQSLGEEQLRETLGISKDTPIGIAHGAAEVKFQPVEGRKLRRGQVQVSLSSPTCDITPPQINLFVDEDVDAPAAIFVVYARTEGQLPLIFAVQQDGGQIATIVQYVQAQNKIAPSPTNLQKSSHTIPVQTAAQVIPVPPPLIITCPYCGSSNRSAARFCARCGTSLNRVTYPPAAPMMPPFPSPPSPTYPPAVPMMPPFPSPPSPTYPSSQPIQPSLSSRICPRCGAANLPGAKYCAICGEKLPTTGMLGPAGGPPAFAPAARPLSPSVTSKSRPAAIPSRRIMWLSCGILLLLGLVLLVLLVLLNQGH
ncbi:MAG: CHAT domain-containing protein [Anaerolineae bacterium]